MNGTIDHRPDRPNKPYRARYLAPDGRQPNRSFRTKREAQAWLRSEVSKIDSGTWVDPAGGSQRYGDHAEKWLAGLVGIKAKTRAGYDGLLRSRVLPTFGDYQLRHIEPAAVRAWIAEMDAEGLSPSRIRQARQVLRASLDQAVHDGLIGRNPVIGVKVPSEPHREMLFLTVPQVRTLSAAAEEQQPGAGTLVTFLAWTGLRWGEAVALRRSSLQLLRHRLNVTESATEVSGKLVFGAPKTHRNRTLVLPKSIATLLAEHLEPGEPTDLIFTAHQGGPLRSSNFRSKVWLPAVAALAETHPGLEGLRLHDLRHTAASLAISAGANIKAIQRMLGHKDISITLNRYGHLYTGDMEDLAARMDEKFRGAA